MPIYQFTARENGVLVEGTRQAASASMLAGDLTAAGLLPVKIEEENERTETTSRPLLRQRVSLSEIIVFSYQMASLSKAGISVVRAIKTLAESSRNATLQMVLHDVAANLEGGIDLASCMGRHPRVFNQLYVSTIHIGENTGRMDEAFKQIGEYLELERETKRRMQAATRYPMFVIATMVIAVVVLNIFVIPAFAEVFAKYGADLPWQTQLIINVSDVFASYWYLMALALMSIGYLGYRYLQTTEGRLKWHTLKLRVPITGTVFERIYLARFCRTFAMVTRAGVPLVQALHIVAQALGNDYMASKVDGMRRNIERGESVLVTARQAAIFSPVVLQMIAVGEETGAMDELLGQAAGFYEEEVDYELKGLTDSIEPILIVGIAILVLIMALGVFLPLWDLNSVAR